jgi:uncharacterized protein YaeQ
MQKLGWYSEDRLDGFGWGANSFGYSIRFFRWNWHGQSCDKRTFHIHVQEPGSEGITKAVRKAAEVALEAWEKFPKSIVHKDWTGKLVVDTNLTKMVFGEAQ